jgi:hypothetical protein
MAEENEVVETEVPASVENASPDTEADAKTQESEAESTPAAEEKDGFGKRIKELTDKVRTGKQAHDREAFELRQENERLQEQLNTRPIATEPLKTLEDFEFDETKHRTYLDERTASIAEKAASNAVGKVQTQIASDQTEQGFRSRETAFESEVSDYVDAVYGETNGQRNWAASATMTDEIRLSEIGPQLAYHLAKNPEIASQIAGLSNRETIRRMTLLESSLKSEKAKKGKSVSDAPPPTPKIPKGDAALSKKITDASVTYKEFVKMRRKQINS